MVLYIPSPGKRPDYLDAFYDKAESAPIQLDEGALKVVAPSAQCAKHYHSSQVRGSPQAIFKIPTALPRLEGPKGYLAGFRVRLTGHPVCAGSV